MKSAEKWAAVLLGSGEAHREANTHWVRQIQIEAMKHGVEKIAKHLQLKLDEYIKEYGAYNSETGYVEMCQKHDECRIEQ